MKARKRCPWCGDDPLYVAYHDTEWGLPMHDDRKHFEFLTLEGAQAGLSWITVLRKRENYRKAFADWDVARVARFTPARVEKLLRDPGIVRNRLKVESVIVNARSYLRIQEKYGSFSAYLWAFVDGRPVLNRWKTLAEIPAATPLSDAVSKDLKRRGFKFIGSTVIYAHLQAAGLVNDHLFSCFRWREVQK
jgi:DNA-3-methyladenine glycosylase I